MFQNPKVAIKGTIIVCELRGAWVPIEEAKLATACHHLITTNLINYIWKMLCTKLVPVLNVKRWCKVRNALIPWKSSSYFWCKPTLSNVHRQALVCVCIYIYMWISVVTIHFCMVIYVCIKFIPSQTLLRATRMKWNYLLLFYH